MSSLVRIFPVSLQIVSDESKHVIRYGVPRCTRLEILHKANKYLAINAVPIRPSMRPVIIHLTPYDAICMCFSYI